MAVGARGLVGPEDWLACVQARRTDEPRDGNASGTNDVGYSVGVDSEVCRQVLTNAPLWRSREVKVR